MERDLHKQKNKRGKYKIGSYAEDFRIFISTVEMEKSHVTGLTFSPFLLVFITFDLSQLLPHFYIYFQFITTNHCYWDFFLLTDFSTIFHLFRFVSLQPENFRFSLTEVEKMLTSPFFFFFFSRLHQSGKIFFRLRICLIIRFEIFLSIFFFFFQQSSDFRNGNDSGIDSKSEKMCLRQV